MNSKIFKLIACVALLVSGLVANADAAPELKASPAVAFRTTKVHGLDIFYREAGDPKAPTVLLLHGFPTSSNMFRNLIPTLAEKYHVVAPDYPGFGYSSMPSVTEYDYTFDNLAGTMEKFTDKLELKSYAIYVMDYGAPVGYRLASRHPKTVTAIVVQNGNAYEEGLGDFWKPIRAYWADRSEANAAPLREFLKPEGTKWQYTHGTRNTESLDPAAWTLDQHFLDRPGNADIQLALFYDYGSNPPLYPKWQEYFRKVQPPTLIVWGRNDAIFPASGAQPYLKDLPNAEYHLLNTGHFALEEDADTIAALMVDFFDRNLKR